MVPTFTIKVAGVEIPPEVADAVQQLAVENDLEMAAALQLELSDDRSQLIDSPMFAGGKSIEVELGYLGDEMRRVFSGEIVRRETFFRLDGAQTATVYAYDRSHRLKRTKHTRSFQQLSDAAIVRQIAQEEGLTPVVDPTPEIYDYVFQNNETNLSFLCGRAERIGYELEVDERSISFVNAAKDGSPVLELKWNFNLHSFEPRLSVSQVPTAVEVRSWYGKDQRLLVGRARSKDLGYTMATRELASDVAGRTFGDAHEVVVSRPMQDEREAEAFARSLMDSMSASYVVGQGSCQGDARLRCGKLVAIAGVGERFSGVYSLKKVVHLYTPTGYTTSFAFRRIGSGETSLAKPEPLPPPRQARPEVEKAMRSFFSLDVKDPFGQRFAGEKVMLFDHQQQTSQVVELDASGRFRKDGIAPGRFSLHLRQLRKARFSTNRLRHFDTAVAMKAMPLHAFARKHGLNVEKLLAYDGGTGIANQQRLPPLKAGMLPKGAELLVPPRKPPPPVKLEAEVLGFEAGTSARVELYAQFRERPEQALKVWRTAVDEDGWIKAEWDGKPFERFVPSFVFKVKLSNLILTSPPLVCDRGPGVPKLAGELSDLGVGGGAADVETVQVVGMRLLDMHGYPLVFQDVQLIDESGRMTDRGVSDRDGQWTSIVPAEGEYDVRLLDAELPSSSSSAGISGLPLRADRADDGIYHLVLKLKDRETRQPLAGVSYTLSLPGGEPKSGKTGRNGLIMHHSVAPGEATLEVFGVETVVPIAEDLDFQHLEHAEKVPVKPYVLAVQRPDDKVAVDWTAQAIGQSRLDVLLQKPQPLPFAMKQKFTPNRSQRQGPIGYVLLGCTQELSQKALEAKIRNPASRFSVHYSIGRTGQVSNYVSPSQKAWHAFRVRHEGRFVDDMSISILLEGDGDAQAYPAEQLDALAHLVMRLLREQGLPEEKVRSAKDLAPEAVGPGQRFDWNDFYARLARVRQG